MSNPIEPAFTVLPLTASELAAIGNNVRDAVARAEEEVRKLNRQRFLDLRTRLCEALVAASEPLSRYQYQAEPVEQTSADAQKIRLSFHHEFGDDGTHRFVSIVEVTLRPEGVSFGSRVNWLKLPEPRPYHIGLAGEGFEKRGDEALEYGLEWIMSSAYRQIRETAEIYGLNEEDMLPKVSLGRPVARTPT